MAVGFTRRDFLRALGLAWGWLCLRSPLGASAEAAPVEGFDSGTRAVREVAEALTGRGRGILEAYPPGSDLFLGLLSLLPEPWRICGLDWGIRLGAGRSRASLRRFRPEVLYAWCVGQYPAKRYPAVLIGAPNGGVAHLAALLGAPFLTTSFLMGFRRPSAPADDLASYAAAAWDLSAALEARLAGEPLEVIHHYDPVHDRLLVKHLSLVRLKLRELPAAYRAFLRERLAPQGRLVLADCRLPWPQRRWGERTFLQIGGLGGLAPQAYLRRWLGPGAGEGPTATEVRRESEWGCPQGFAEAVRAFAARQGLELIELGFDHPQDYSVLAYRAYRQAGATASELMLDCFTQSSPRTNLWTGLPALWLPFNTEDSCAFARDFLDRQAGGHSEDLGRTFQIQRIYLALLPSFAQNPDLVPLARWRAMLEEYGDLELVGVSPRLFPADPLAPFRFAAHMRRLRRRRRHARATPLSLSPSALEALVETPSRPP